MALLSKLLVLATKFLKVSIYCIAAVWISSSGAETSAPDDGAETSAPGIFFAQKGAQLLTFITLYLHNLY